MPNCLRRWTPDKESRSAKTCFRRSATASSAVALGLLGQASELGVAVHRVARSPSERVSLTEGDGLLSNWLSAKGACAVLVRPDHMVFGTAADVRQAEGLLRELRSDLAA